MNSKTVIFIIITAWLFLVPFLQPVRGDDVTNQEYQIKAAFLFNFLKFVEWPKSKTKDPNEPIIIGIIGENLFKDAFENLKNRSIEGKKVIVKQYKGISEFDNAPKEHPQIKAIRESHLLFISPSEKIFALNILESVKEYGVLTVADYKGFLEAGGIINLVMEEKKVQFEINMIAAKQSGITIRSQLLRLAKKVIRQETSSADTDPPFTAKQTTLASRVSPSV
jgi:hypothetical protein